MSRRPRYRLGHNPWNLYHEDPAADTDAAVGVIYDVTLAAHVVDLLNAHADRHSNTMFKKTMTAVHARLPQVER